MPAATHTTAPAAGRRLRLTLKQADSAAPLGYAYFVGNGQGAGVIWSDQDHFAIGYPDDERQCA